MAFQFLDRAIRPPSTSAEIVQRLSGVHDEWLMTDAERSAVHSMLVTLKPQVAIEVGVYRAGSLAILAAQCQRFTHWTSTHSVRLRMQAVSPTSNLSPGHHRTLCQNLSNGSKTRENLWVSCLSTPTIPRKGSGAT